MTTPHVTEVVRHGAGPFIGPIWEYVNPQGVRFTARTADTIAILRIAAGLRDAR